MNLALRLIDEAAAQAVVAGGAPSGYRRPQDYPAVPDRVAAGLFLQRLEAGLDPRPFGAFLVLIAADIAESPPLVVGGAGFHGGVDDGGWVEIGYAIVPSQQGRGYATKALGLLIERARELGALALFAEVDAPNAASRAVLTRCGFVASSSDVERFELLLGR